MNYLRLTIVLFIVLAAIFFFLLPISKVVPRSNFFDFRVKTDPKIVKVENYQEAPMVSAKSVVVLDAKTGDVLYEKNPTSRLLPASTTKLLTALTALENCSLDQVVTVDYVEKEPTQMGLFYGDKLTVESLLYGLLISSGNDAAYVLAYSCSPSVADFVSNMNEKARQLGLKNSLFTNPAGFDDPGEYSTAKDLAILARAAVTNPLIAKIVATKTTVVTDVTGNRSYYLENVNKLLGSVDGVDGIKTGQTEGALGNLITKTERSGNIIVTVVMGSVDRFEDSTVLIEWAFKNYHWQTQ